VKHIKLSGASPRGMVTGRATVLAGVGRCYTRSMSEAKDNAAVKRVLIVMPNWLGDTVMATATLRALSQIFPQAHRTALLRRHLRPILRDCPWVDRMVSITRSGTSGRRSSSPARLARRLARGRFDLAVLLPNSFRSALIVRLAGIPRRIGYNRDGRGIFLTDRLTPLRNNDGFVPVCTRDYYLDIARRLGDGEFDDGLELFTQLHDDEQAEGILREAGWQGPADQPLIVITPGANFGEAKMWSARRFAKLADRCVAELGAFVAVSGAPGEKPILDEIIQSAEHPVADLPRLGIDLQLLKSVIKQASVVVTNDTGPRHIAIAMARPVVTIFGPTDPAWTEMNYADERQVLVNVDCAPCQQKICPLAGTAEELQCMRLIEPEMVFEQVNQLLRSS